MSVPLNGNHAVSETVGRAMEILLIEDSLMAARLTARAIRERPFDHRLTWLTDGCEALRYLAREGCYARAPRPDLILLDLVLPGCSGQQILERMQQDASLTNVPVVVLTGEAVPENNGSTVSPQVRGYLTKPFQADQFQELLTQLRGTWRSRMLRAGSV